MRLPEYVSRPLAYSPLALVAAQINFEEIGRGVEHKQARSVQKALGTEWASLAATPLVEATMTPAGAVNQPNRSAYRLATSDGAWSVLLNPDRVTLETTSYDGWARFSQRLSLLARAVADVFDPGTEQRLGLRYVDQIPLPTGWDGWQGLIPDTLLGVAIDDRFDDGVLGSDQRLLLQLEEGIQCVLRHGLLTNAATNQVGAAYLLDYDVFRENRPYDAGGLDEGAATLHSYVGRLFRASITDDLYAVLKG